MRKVVVLCCVLYQTLYSDTHRNSSACNHFLFLITVKMSEAEGRSHLIRLPSSVKWRGCGSSPQDLRHQITLFARLIITSWNQTWQRFSTRPGSPDSRTQLAPRFTSFLGLGFVSFMGYVLLEKWSSSRIQPPKKKSSWKKASLVLIVCSCDDKWTNVTWKKRSSLSPNLTRLLEILNVTLWHTVSIHNHKILSHGFCLRFFRCLVPNQLPSRIQRAHIGTLRPIFAGRF